MVARSLTAGDVEINLCIGNPGGIERFEDSGTDPVDVNACDLNRREAIGKSPEVFFQSKNLPIIASYHFVNAVSKEQPAVQIDRFELIKRHNFILHQSDLHKIGPDQSVST